MVATGKSLLKFKTATTTMGDAICERHRSSILASLGKENAFEHYKKNNNPSFPNVRTFQTPSTQAQIWRMQLMSTLPTPAHNAQSHFVSCGLLRGSCRSSVLNASVLGVIGLFAP
jgi:hypothetical protein